MNKKGARWDLFFYHLGLFIVVHLVFAFFFGVQPLSQLGSESYVDHIQGNFMKHGINIYQNPTVNVISGVWKTILFVHFIIEIIETLFPRKKSNDDENVEKKVDVKKENPSVAWIYLVIAGLLEIVWATALKLDMLGGPVIIVLIISFDLLVKAVRRLGVGTAYAVFTGMGTAGLVLVDVLFFKETMSLMKMLFIVMLVVFIIGLKWTSEPEGDVDR